MGKYLIPPIESRYVYLYRPNNPISGHQQRWPRLLPGAILIPPALLVVADYTVGNGGADAVGV